MIEFHQLTAYIETLRESANIPGVSIAIVKDGLIIYSNGFGHYDHAPFSPETPIEVASLSKPVFAYTVLKLCEQGVLNLDKPLSDYLPQPYLSDEPYLSLITARHTLSHTSGFPNWRDADGLRAMFTPGSAFNYSTEGLIYLQTVIEYLIGQPFHQYVRTHLLEPFEMHNSEFLPIDMRPFPAYLPRHLHSFGAVSLQTTASDYARFLIEMMCEEVSDEFHLSQRMIREMLRPHIPVGEQEGLFWGMGWGLQQLADEESAFWHWGQRLDRTRNFALGIPSQQLGIVILTNHIDGLRICDPIIQMVMNHPDSYPAFKWLLPPEQWRADGRKVN